MPKEKKEKNKWEWEGTEFHHCPSCSKAIPTAWTKHIECGWDMNEDVAKDGEIFTKEEIKKAVPGISDKMIDQAARLMRECKEVIEKEFGTTIAKQPEIIPCINSLFIEVNKRSRA